MRLTLRLRNGSNRNAESFATTGLSREPQGYGASYQFCERKTTIRQS